IPLLVEAGRVYELRGELDQAQTIYEEVLGRSQRDEFGLPGAASRDVNRAKAGLARVLLASKQRLDEADSLLIEALEADVDATHILDLEPTQDDGHTQLEVLSRAHLLRPERADVLVMIADLHSRVGNVSA